MNYSIDDLSAKELSIIALAVEYFLCNYDHDTMAVEGLEDLFMHLDVIAEAAEEAAEDSRLVEKTDNLLVVDFSPKSG